MRVSLQLIVCILTMGLLPLLGSGCASVKVKEVNNLEGPSGLRFYMPRPYVSVHEPFIVAAEPYLTSGYVSPDGRFVTVDHVPEKLSNQITRSATGGAQMSYVPVPLGELADSIGKLESTPRGLGGQLLGNLSSEKLLEIIRDLAGQKGAESILTEIREALEKGMSDEETPTSDPETGGGDGDNGEKPKVDVKTGVLTQKMTNDNGAFAMVALKRYFDVVYLPDFDREMIVQGRAGLGNASIVMQMGQSWSLQGIETTADNSELTKRMYQIIDTGMKLGTTALGGGAGGGVATDAVAKLFSGTRAIAAPVGASLPPGVPVAVKITKLRIAAPGLYPILKPEEYKNVDQSKFPAESGERILLPIYPYTNIAFNTYSVLVVEAAEVGKDTSISLRQVVDAGTPAPASERTSEKESE